MSPMASQITSLEIVYSTVYSSSDQRKHHSSASLAFVRRIHRGPVNSPHKRPVTRKIFSFDDVIMIMSMPSGDDPRHQRSGWLLWSNCEEPSHSRISTQIAQRIIIPSNSWLKAVFGDYHLNLLRCQRVKYSTRIYVFCRYMYYNNAQQFDKTRSKTDSKSMCVRYWPDSQKTDLDFWNNENSPRGDYTGWQTMRELCRWSGQSAWSFHNLRFDHKTLWKVNVDKFDILMKFVLNTFFNSNNLIKRDPNFALVLMRPDSYFTFLSVYNYMISGPLLLTWFNCNPSMDE